LGAQFRRLDWKHCKRVMQVGAGTGYCAAVLAELVAPNGRVIAVEYDGELAAKARVNLRPWGQVEVIHDDGRTHDQGEVDAIIAFASSTHPAPLWLDRLAPGGQLLMPLTAGGASCCGSPGAATMTRASSFFRPAETETDSMPYRHARSAFSHAAARATSRQRSGFKTRSMSCAADSSVEALHRGDPGPMREVRRNQP
jgi:protein-L-isoaspartate O-methyltransferase